MMDKRRNTFRRSVAVFAGLCGVLAFCDVAQAVDVPAAGPGVTRITLKHEGKPEMPGALFDHEAHAARVKDGGGDCAVCHTFLGKDAPAGAGPLSIVPSTGRQDKDDLMEAWHETCLSCHSKYDAAPKAASCRSCHDATPVEEQRLPVVFDRALHDVHIASSHISPVAPQRTEGDSAATLVQNCGACHSVPVSTESGKEKNVYIRGTEDASTFFKTDSTDPDVLASIAHNSCVSCHVETMASRSGRSLDLPVNCVDCHSAEGQAKFPAASDSPTRLLRGQPDTIVLGAALGDTSGSKSSDPRAALKPVPFDHKLHEDVASCASCHGMKIETTEEGQPVTMAGTGPDGKVRTAYDAAHDPASPLSCVGCHAQVIAEDKNCAGCHYALKFEVKDSCSVCHSGEVKGGGSAFPAFLMGERKASQPIDPADVPETVTIDDLSNEYQPVELPHRKIYEAMLKGMKDNRLAAAFHVDSVCKACHHNIPNDNIANPPSCASCHEKEVKSVGVDQLPSLKAAYHQMCIGCHSAMDVKPAASDCAGCHAPKNAEASEDSNKNKREVR